MRARSPVGSDQSCHTGMTKIEALPSGMCRQWKRARSPQSPSGRAGLLTWLVSIRFREVANGKQYLQLLGAGITLGANDINGLPNELLEALLKEPLKWLSWFGRPGR